jgi:phosphopantetheinyl transferase
MSGGNANRFYEVWTKKESRIKWEGKGLYKPLHSFSVFNSEQQEAVFYHMVYRSGEAVCHVCSKHKNEPTVRIIDASMLLQNIKKML